MSVVATIMRELMALGVSGDALVAAVDRIADAVETDRARSVDEAVSKASEKADRDLAERKARAAERTRKWRDRSEPVTSPNVTVTSHTVTERHPTCEGARVVTPSLPSLRSEELGGGGGVTRDPDDWPAGRASDHAERLISDIASAWLDPSKSPDLVTTRGRLAAWRRDGASWEHDVVPVVTAACLNRRSKISSWKFFDQAIARSIAENRAALEIPEAGSVVQLRQTGPPRSFDEKSRDAWDYALKRIAEDG